MPADGSQMIYVIRESTFSRALKIGHSTNVQSRIADHQSSNPGELKLVTSFPGTRTQEKAVQAALVNYRIRGEWFIDAAEVWKVLERAQEGHFPRRADRPVPPPEQPDPNSPRGIVLRIASLAQQTGVSYDEMKRRIMEDDAQHPEVSASTRKMLEPLREFRSSVKKLFET